jgi:hypothetical protein
MLNISKSPAVIFGCSAIVAASLGGFASSASAAEQFNNKNGQRGTFLIAQTIGPTNASQASGVNVGTITNPSIPQPIGPGGISPATTARIDGFVQSFQPLEANLSQARAEVTRLESIVTAAPDTSPVRFTVDKGVADLASCGCPDAEAIGSTPATNTPSPELVAARDAEAKAAAELAAAKAEARQFIESVKSERSATSRTVDTSLW